VITHRNTGHARADLAHDACALVAQDAGKNAFAIQAVERVRIGVADARGFDFHQHLARLRAFEIKLDNFKRLLCLERNRSFRLHRACSKLSRRL